MCNVDYEPADIYDASLPRARRATKCCECCREIAKGENYERVRALWDGYWSTFRTCSHCIAARKWLLDRCKSFAHGAVYADLRDHFLEVLDWEPGELFRVGRYVLGIRRKWRRSNGDLSPVPNAEGSASHV